MYDIIIIGAGPAGMTACLYALRANKKVLLLEAKGYGGQIVNAYIVENYPGIDSISGYDLATNFYNQIKNLGATIKYDKVIGIDKNKVFTNNETYETKAIIIATGANNRKLDLLGEDLFIGKGISYCATCDGNFYRNKVVAIVGGGNTALMDAIYLSNIAKKVYFIHRRDIFKGDKKYLDELKKCDNVEFVLNSSISKLIGDDKLYCIEIIDSNNNSMVLDVDGLFVAIGQVPNNDIFKNVVLLDSNGYIISDDGVHTSCKHVYVCGDARVKDVRQLTTAVSDGSIAAMVAIKEISEEIKNG